MKNIFKNKFAQFLLIFILCMGFNTLPVNASDTDGELLDVYPIPSITFSDHRGMKPSKNGHWVYCIQRGYPFRSMCSEMQMCRGYYDTGLEMGGYTDPETGESIESAPITYEGKLSEIVAHMNDVSGGNSATALWFRGCYLSFYLFSTFRKPYFISVTRIF